MKLRDYQLAAVEAVIDCWRRNIRRCLVVLPTGCGKTVVFGEIVRRLIHGEITANQQPSTNNQQPPPRAMILAHRGELIQQAADKVGRMAGVEAQIEMGETRVRRRSAESGETVDVAEELGRTLAEIKAAKLAEAKRRAFVQATARYTMQSVDAFNVFDLPPVEGRAADPRIRLSYKQQALLRERIKADPARLSAPQGRQLIDEYFRRIRRGLSSIPQARYLRRHGVPVPMKFAEASRTITRLMNGGAR